MESVKLSLSLICRVTGEVPASTNLLVASTLAAESSETRTVRRISLVARIVVVLNWIAILTILATHGVPRNIALGAFTIFRIIAVLAVLWLIAETAEGLAGRISFVRVLIDGLLTLPMFAFWFLVAASTL